MYETEITRLKKNSSSKKEFMSKMHKLITMSSGRIEHARSKISFTARCVAHSKWTLDKIRLMCVCDGPTFHRSRRQAGRTHTHTDGRTTPKHNASGSIYWIRGGIKRTYAYIVKCSGVTRVNKGETAATRLICVLNLHVVFWFCLFAIILVSYFSQSVIYLWRNWSLLSFCLHLFLEFCIAVIFVLLPVLGE